MMWISNKQVDYVIRQNCVKAENINGFAVEVLSGIIKQQTFRNKRLLFFLTVIK